MLCVVALVEFISPDKNINWTAISCLITVIVLFATITDNRKRFEKDWITRVRVSDSDKLIDLVSQYIGNYQQHQRFAVEILMRSAGIINSGDNNQKIQEKNDLRDGAVIKLGTITSQIEMLEMRLPNEISNKGLLEKINCINKETDEFYFDNLNASVDLVNDENETREKIKEKCQELDKLTKENIKIIQIMSAEICQELVTIKH